MAVESAALKKAAILKSSPLMWFNSHEPIIELKMAIISVAGPSFPYSIGEK
jgi:hypothetical protein